MSTKQQEHSITGGLLFLGFFLAVGLSVAGYFISQTLLNSRIAVNTASVKGLAERKVKSDLVVWDIPFTMQADTLVDANAAADAKKSVARDFLLDAGFSAEELSFANSVYIAEYRDEGVLKDKKYNVTTTITLRTEHVDKAEAMRQRLGDLIAKGVAVTNSSPRYLFTKLNDIKPEMLGEATQNARLAAAQFAEDAGAKVGGIQSASQGSFSIGAYDEIDSYGTDTTSLYKKVRVVTTITFYLE